MGKSDKSKKMNQSLDVGPVPKGNSTNGVKSNGPMCEALKRNSQKTSHGN